MKKKFGQLLQNYIKNTNKKCCSVILKQSVHAFLINYTKWQTFIWFALCPWHRRQLRTSPRCKQKKKMLKTNKTLSLERNLIITILEHFLDHRIFVWHHCTLDQLDNPSHEHRHHSSRHRIVDSQLGEGISDGQLFDR